MLGALLVFFQCPLNYDVTFKIIVKFEIIIIDFEYICDFKSHIIVERTLGEQ